MGRLNIDLPDPIWVHLQWHLLFQEGDRAVETCWMDFGAVIASTHLTEVVAITPANKRFLDFASWLLRTSLLPAYIRVERSFKSASKNSNVPSVCSTTLGGNRYEHDTKNQHINAQLLMGQSLESSFPPLGTECR